MNLHLPPHPDSIGIYLRHLRQTANKTLRQVKNATGLDPASICELEKGRIKNPSYRKVYKLLEYYNKYL